MPEKVRLLVLRFSAMGDVAMVASVLKEFIEQHPEVEIVMVSRGAFKAFFEDIDKVIFHPFDPKTKHKGILGIYKLYLELSQYKPFAVADLHDHIRSRLLCALFRLTRIKIKRIDKGRADKQALTRKTNKVLKPLLHTTERYADVFRALGFEFNLSHQLKKQNKNLPLGARNLFSNNKRKVGIAPFAQHEFKMYPLQLMEEVISQLSSEGFQLFIFGGGVKEREIADGWERKFTSVVNLIGKFSLADELAIISNLEVMLTMDSSGMHMASLEGIPTISIWGPTHPYAGFLGYGQQFSDCLQVEHPSRPNSVYGNKPCLCGDVPCISLVNPAQVVKKIKERLNNG